MPWFSCNSNGFYIKLNYINYTTVVHHAISVSSPEEVFDSLLHGRRHSVLVPTKFSLDLQYLHNVLRLLKTCLEKVAFVQSSQSSANQKMIQWLDVAFKCKVVVEWSSGLVANRNLRDGVTVQIQSKSAQSLDGILLVVRVHSQGCNKPFHTTRTISREYGSHFHSCKIT